MNVDEILYNIYYSLKNPNSFSSVDALLKSAKEVNSAITREYVKKWLSSQLTYTLHRPATLITKTRPIVVYSIDECWEADLFVFTKLAKFNDDYKYVLLIIDVLSKYIWLRALKTKTGLEVNSAINDIFENSSRRPQYFRCDNGVEFLNSHVRKTLKSRKIKLIPAFSQNKASIAERSIRTIKGIIFKYFTYKNTRRYIDKLQKFADKYNNSYHRTIKMSPNEVNKGNESRVWINVYENKIKRQNYKESNIKINDYVRISVKRNEFHKSFLPLWTEEIFKITHVFIVHGITLYRLSDHQDELISGAFYRNEIQKVIPPSTYRVEKVLKTIRNKDKTKSYLVKWSGYSDKFNSIIPESDFQSMR